MCGISGVYCYENALDKAENLIKMHSALWHRGPDDDGFLFYRRDANRLIVDEIPPADEAFEIALAHRRLSIIDLSSAGHQPMRNEDGSLWLVYNGEIFNYIELRAELIALGHTFASQTDSEVILHAYEQWGKECLNRFNGMWAFALLDVRDNSLFCARDRFGIKPFYYAESGDRFYFASELKALLAVPSISTELSDRKVYRYLMWGVVDDDEQTLINSIKRIRPGYSLLVSNSGIREQRYYELKTKVYPVAHSEKENEEKFRELFDSAVQLRLRSDVPIGTCLSGGLDSSLILATIRKLLGPQQELSTFSAIFEGEAVDESKYARIMIEAVAARPHFTTPTGADLLRDLDDLIYCQDEPFWSTSAYNHWRVMKLAREAGVKVLLDGQGGDELLAGYDYYYWEFFLHLFKQKKLTTLRQEMAAARRIQGFSLGRQISHALSRTLPSSWRTLLQRHLNFTEKAVIDQRFFKDKSIQKEYADICHDQVLNRNFHDFFYSLPYLLRLEDRNSMAFSIESRVPFLDYRLVEFLLTVPAEQKIKNGRTKYLLRKSFANRLPSAILDRTDKIGFFTPEQKWLRNELAEPLNDTFQSQRFRERGFYDYPKLLAYVKNFQRGEANNSHILWRWFNLEKWLELVEKRFRNEYSHAAAEGLPT